MSSYVRARLVDAVELLDVADDLELGELVELAVLGNRLVDLIVERINAEHAGRHLVELVDEGPILRGLYTAVCSCGWRSGLRGSLELAEDEGDEHREEAIEHGFVDD